MSAETEEVVRNFFSALDAFDLDRAYAITAPDFAYYPRGAATALTIEDHKRSMDVLHDAFDAYEHKVVEQFSCGEMVATRFVFFGLMQASYVGAAPSGKRETCSGIAIDRVVDGKLVERHVEVDLLGLIQRSGNRAVSA